MTISKSKSSHGNELHLGGTSCIKVEAHNELHLGGSTAKIFQLGIQTEQSRLAYSKITRFKDRKIWLKIDQNRLKKGQIAFSRPWIGEKL